MTEKMYADFIANVLPNIQEGLVITKDYFFDLFGRYVTYLIVTDSIQMFIGLVLIVGSIVAFKPLQRFCEKEWLDIIHVVILLSLPIMIGIIFFLASGYNLIKDIYIPEVRVLQELQNIKK